jgi:hypothetical protein
MGTYGTQLAKERAEIGATRIAELFFEEIEVDEDVRYCVLVYLLDGSIREEVLQYRILIHVVSNLQSSKGGTWTNHEALCDVRRCCAIRLVLVQLADLQRVDDRREPIDELVEVHARSVLAHCGRPVVL